MARAHGSCLREVYTPFPPSLQPPAGAPAAGDLFGAGPLPEGSPYSKPPQEVLRELVRRGGVLTAVQSRRLEELFGYCRERKLDPRLLFPLFRGLSENPQRAASVTRDALIAQLMGVVVMLDLQTHFVPGNIVYDRLPEEKRELIRDFVRTILPLLENWSIHAVVQNGVEEMGNFAMAVYDPQKDAYVLQPLEYLPPLLHYVSQQTFVHELFHAYQDVKEEEKNRLELEDAAHLVGGLAVYALGITTYDYDGKGHGRTCLYKTSWESAPFSESAKAETSAVMKFLMTVYPEFSPGQEATSIWELNLLRSWTLVRKDVVAFDKMNAQFLEKLAQYYSLTAILGMVAGLLEVPLTPEERKAMLDRTEELMESGKTLESEREKIEQLLPAAIFKTILLYKGGRIAESKEVFEKEFLPHCAAFYSLVSSFADGVPSKPAEEMGE